MACPRRGAEVRAWPGIVPVSRIRGPARGSPAATAAYQRGQQAWPLRPVRPALGRGRWSPHRRRSRWQAGHTSLPEASFAQPAATARARLPASPSVAGSANAVSHPATAHPAAGTRIWSPMTQCPVIATGSISGSDHAAGCQASRSPSARTRTGAGSAPRPARRATPGRLACLGKRPEVTGPRIIWRHAARCTVGGGARQRGAGRGIPERAEDPPACKAPDNPGSLRPARAGTRSPFPQPLERQCAVRVEEAGGKHRRGLRA
jgi:hypothetical protein